MKKPPYSYSRKSGLTLIDVLVVITVIVVLAAVILPQLARARIGSGPRSLDMNNLHQQAIALFVYAGDNKEFLPVNSPPARYCWDLDTAVADQLTNNGTTPTTFYDTGTEPRFGPSDFSFLWTNHAAYPLTNAVFGQSGYRQTGYAFTLYGTADYGFDDKLHATSPVATNANQKLNSAKNPSKKTLAAFATIATSPATGAPSDKYQTFNTYNWTNIPMDYKFNGVLKPFTSPHLDAVGKPTGGNEVMLDGHVEWILFPKMIHRTIGDVIFYY
jgi:type II secretory pathway pseudopilin PulG